jgi:hypothetical protein
MTGNIILFRLQTAWKGSSVSPHEWIPGCQGQKLVGAARLLRTSQYSAAPRPPSHKRSDVQICSRQICRTRTSFQFPPCSSYKKAFPICEKAFFVTGNGRGGEITPYIPVLRRSAAALAQALGRSNLFPTNLSNPDFVSIPALFQLQKKPSRFVRRPFL